MRSRDAGVAPTGKLPLRSDSNIVKDMSQVAGREFYDTQYHFAEDASRPDERRIWHALKRLEPLAGTSFLDLGCGAGWATRLAKIEGRTVKVLGLDFSKTALDLARRHTPDILWVQADGT